MDIDNKVYEIITKVFRIKREAVNEMTAMDNIDTWDSLSHMELILSLEVAFNIQFTDYEIVELVSVGAIKQVIKEKLKNEHK